MKTPLTFLPHIRRDDRPSFHMTLWSGLRLGLATAVLCVFTNRADADTYTFNNSSGDNSYNNGANWTDVTTGTTGTVPSLQAANTAQINDGAAVTYLPGGDLIIKNNGVLEVSNGSFTQITGGAYLQLNGNGTILVDGGTFNQGTATSSPFNVSGTGNIFNMSSGAANFNRGFTVATGLTSTISGGTLTATGGNLVVGTNNTAASYMMTGGTASFGPASGSTGTYAIQVNQSSTLTLSNGASLSANGGFTAATGSTTTVSDGTTTFSLGTGGFNVNAGATYTQNAGTVSATSGDLTYNGNMTVKGGTLTTSSGALAGYGTLNVSGGSITASGGFNVNTSTSPVSSGNVNVSGGTIRVGSVNVATGGTMTLSAGSLTTTNGNVTNVGTFTLSGANISLNSTASFVAQGTNTTISGGTITVGKEFDFNNDQNYLTGGTINTPLITGVNGGGVANTDGTTTHALNISGGLLNLTGTFSNGIYGGDSTKYINFLPNSSGVIDFTNNDTMAVVQAFITNNVIEYNATPYSASTGFSNFSFGTDANGFVTLMAAGVTPVPEPATVLAGGLLAAFALPMAVRRLRRKSPLPA